MEKTDLVTVISNRAFEREVIERQQRIPNPLGPTDLADMREAINRAADAVVGTPEVGLHSLDMEQTCQLVRLVRYFNCSVHDRAVTSVRTLQPKFIKRLIELSEMSGSQNTFFDEARTILVEQRDRRTKQRKAGLKPVGQTPNTIMYNLLGSAAFSSLTHRTIYEHAQ